MAEQNAPLSFKMVRIFQKITQSAVTNILVPLTLAGWTLPSALLYPIPETATIESTMIPVQLSQGSKPIGSLKAYILKNWS